MSDVELEGIDLEIEKYNEQPPRPTNRKVSTSKRPKTESNDDSLLKLSEKDISAIINEKPKTKSKAKPAENTDVQPTAGLLLKIEKYINTFPKLLQNHKKNITKYQKYSAPQLEKILKDIQITVSNKNSNNFSDIIGAVGLNVYEQATQIVGLKTQGIAQVLQHNEAFNDCLKEILLEYEQFNYTNPKVRMALILLATTGQVHTINSLKEQSQAQPQTQQKNNDEEFILKSDDL